MMAKTFLSMEKQKVAKRLCKLEKKLMKHPLDGKAFKAKKSLMRRVKEINKEMSKLTKEN